MKAWDLQKTHYSVSDFLDWQKNGTLILSPSFQRRAVWKKGAKSFLLDTIVRGLPVPVILLRDRVTNIKSLKKEREVIDGQQRLRTVLSFVSPDSLKDFHPERDSFTITKAHNKMFAGKKFQELDSDTRQRILDFQFSVQIFPANTEDAEILQIFARLNATGMKLNEQELRNAEFFGEFKSISYSLAAEQLSFWRNTKLFTEDQIARMAEVEFTSELLIAILNGITAGTASMISKFYKTYDEEFSSSDEVRARFDHTLNYLQEMIQKYDVAPYMGKKIVVYALFSAAYDAMYGLKSQLKKTKAKAVTPDKTKGFVKRLKALADNQAPAGVLEGLSKRTTHPGTRKAAFDYFNAAKN